MCGTTRRHGVVRGVCARTREIGRGLVEQRRGPVGPPRQHKMHGVACGLFDEIDRRRRRSALTIPVVLRRRRPPQFSLTRFDARRPRRRDLRRKRQGPAADLAQSRHGLEPRSGVRVVGFAPFPLDASSHKFRLDANERASSKDRKRLLACPLNAARDRRGKVLEMPRGPGEQREALDHVWDAALCGSLPRLRDALQREGAARAASSSGALVRPPWAFVSARDRTPRLGRTALHLVSLGAARAVAAAQRRLGETAPPAAKVREETCSPSSSRPPTTRTTRAARDVCCKERARPSTPRTPQQERR